MKSLSNFLKESQEEQGLTLADFKNEFPQYKNLIQAVYNQMGEDDEDFFNDLENAGSHGADGGYNGFIYYQDTVDFFKRNRNEIRKYAEEQADTLGDESLYDMVTKFNQFDKKTYNIYDVMDAFNEYVDWEEVEEYEGYTEKDEDELEGLYNLLAWYALEEVGHLYIQWQDM